MNPKFARCLGPCAVTKSLFGLIRLCRFVFIKRTVFVRDFFGRVIFIFYGKKHGSHADIKLKFVRDGEGKGQRERIGEGAEGGGKGVGGR